MHQNKYSINNYIILLLILPYVINTLPNIIFSDLNNYFYLIISILIIFLLNHVYNKINHKLIRIIIINLIILILYTSYILPYVGNFFLKLSTKIWPFFILFCILINLFHYFIINRFTKFLSLFLIILNIVGTLNFLYIFSKNKIIHINKNKIYSSIDKKSKILLRPPILLIIMDEYASPYEIEKIKIAKSNFNFSNKLKSEGWIVKEKFYSQETKTIKSISSLFNLNLNKDIDFKNRNFKYCDIYLNNTKLVNNLNSKKVDFINWGIFKINSYTPLSIDVYPTPNNFIELFFINSLVGSIKNKFKNIYYNNLNENKSTTHNIKIINLFKYSKIPNNCFLYSHLLMPHSPFNYNSEFRYSTVISYDYNYVNYWNFTNKKVLESLISLRYNNPNLRIIITGDHGYRDNLSINASYTYGAFLGFTTEELKNVNTVADIGQLIEDSY